MSRKSNGGRLKHIGKHLTGPADFHFIGPFFVNIAVTNGTVDEPTKIATLEFPSGALSLLFGGAFLHSPTGFVAVRTGVFFIEQKKHLSFNGWWNGTPTLFIAVYRFERYAE